MRHRKAGRKLGRTSAHRKAMFSNMLASLVEHERIQTTEAKAKELRRIAERTITWATSLGDLLTKKKEDMTVAERAKVVHHIRMARRALKDRDLLRKLFEEIGPRYVGRPGGYTRIIHHSKRRHGDGAPLAFLELVESQEETGGREPSKETESAESK